MFVFLIAGLALIVVAAALAARAFALPRIRTTQQLGQIGSYGFGGREETSLEGGIEAAVERIADRLGHRLGSDEDDGAGVREMLIGAGMYSTALRTFFGYRVLCAIVVPALWLWLGPLVGQGQTLVLLATMPAAWLGWLLPMRIVRKRGDHRRDQIDSELPELIDALIVTVEAGMGFNGALRLAARQISGPLGDEVGLALHEQDMGLSTEVALKNMLQRADTPAMRSFVRSVVQAENLGVSIGEIMRALAVEMRARRRARAEERAQQAPVKLIFPLVLLIFPSMFIVLLYPAASGLMQALSSA
jgi:pilus assembly protein TadC